MPKKDKTDNPSHCGKKAKFSLEKKLASLQFTDKWAVKVTKLRAWSQSFEPGKCSRQAFLIAYESNLKVGGGVRRSLVIFWSLESMIQQTLTEV